MESPGSCFSKGALFCPWLQEEAIPPPDQWEFRWGLDVRQTEPSIGKRVHQVARMLRRNATSAEKRLWSRIRAGQLSGFQFRRQFPIGEFIVDFCCRSRRLVIELDGSQHAILPAWPRIENVPACLRSEDTTSFAFGKKKF